MLLTIIAIRYLHCLRMYLSRARGNTTSSSHSSVRPQVKGCGVPLILYYRATSLLAEKFGTPKHQISFKDSGFFPIVTAQPLIMGWQGIAGDRAGFWFHHANFLVKPATLVFYCMHEWFHLAGLWVQWSFSACEENLLNSQWAVDEAY